MAGMATKALKTVNDTQSDASDWQQRFMADKKQDFIEVKETPWLPRSEQQAQANQGRTRFGQVTNSRHGTALTAPAKTDEEEHDKEVYAVIAELQQMLFVHDQVMEARASSENRPLAEDAVLRHTPAYRFSSPPPDALSQSPGSSEASPPPRAAWGDHVLRGIYNNKVDAVRRALALPGAYVEAVIENEQYLTRGGASHESRHSTNRGDWERNTFGGVVLFSRTAEGTTGIRGCWSAVEEGQEEPPIGDGVPGEVTPPGALFYAVGDTALMVAIRNDKFQVAADMAGLTE